MTSMRFHPPETALRGDTGELTHPRFAFRWSSTCVALAKHALTWENSPERNSRYTVHRLWPAVFRCFGCSGHVAGIRPHGLWQQTRQGPPWLAPGRALRFRRRARSGRARRPLSAAPRPGLASLGTPPPACVLGLAVAGLPLVLAGRRVELREPHCASLDHVRVCLRNVVEKQLPIAAVEGLDERLGDGHRATFGHRGALWFTLVAGGCDSVVPPGSDLR